MTFDLKNSPPPRLGNDLGTDLGTTWEGLGSDLGANSEMLDEINVWEYSQMIFSEKTKKKL